MFIYSPYNNTEATPSLFSAILIYSIYTISFLIVLSVSIIIFHLTLTIEKLQTQPNLLICNTCVISLFYLCTIFLQVFMVFLAPLHSIGKDSRLFCIIRAYLTAVSTTLLSWSFLLQALSRLFHIIFHFHRRSHSTWNFHYMLIAIQWIMGFLTPITILIRHDDVIYQRGIFCTIELNNTLHLYYLYSTEYLIPVLVILLIYITSVYQVNHYSTPSTHRHPSPAREHKLLNKIIIFVGIFTFGGLPSIIYICLMVPHRILSIHFFILTLISIPLAISIEKLSALWLTTPLRHAFIRCCCCVEKRADRNSMTMRSTAAKLVDRRNTSYNHSTRDISRLQTLP